MATIFIDQNTCPFCKENPCVCPGFAEGEGTILEITQDNPVVFDVINDEGALTFKPCNELS